VNEVVARCAVTAGKERRRGCGTFVPMFVGTRRRIRSVTGCSGHWTCSSVDRSATWYAGRHCGRLDASSQAARTMTPSCHSATLAPRSSSSTTSYR